MMGKSSSQIFTQGVAIPSEPSEPHHPQCDSDSDTVFTTAAASTPSFIDLENMRPSFLPNPHIPIMNDDIAAAAAMHVPNADILGPNRRRKTMPMSGGTSGSCGLAALRPCLVPPPLSLHFYFRCHSSLSRLSVHSPRAGDADARAGGG